MAMYTIHGARFAGCAITLGEHKHRIDDEPEYYRHDPAQLPRLKTIIGMDERYTAKDGTTSADLCERSARKLLDALDRHATDVGTVISVTQTPDHLMPGNAHVLHGRLGLPTTTQALDLNMGCSGFVYGLWLATMAAQAGSPVLLLAGDTLSKKAGTRDRTTAPLFGDAGSAALIVPDPDAPPIYFALHADGVRYPSMFIPAGGSREPSTEATRRENEDGDGNVRSLEDVFMDGFGIFSFTMTEQPKLLREILNHSGKSKDEIDFFVLHQANRYIVETITRKAGIPAEKAPADVFSRFGNQNAASIPGVLCGALADQLRDRTAEVIFQGYGTGLSWGACQLRLENCLCLPPFHYGDEAGGE